MPGTGDAKILLVDDSIGMSDIAKKVFKLAGHEIDTVDNGRDGVDMIEKGDYDLVLLDIRMPGMDGFEVFQRLRSQEKTKLLPEIIFFSDYENMEKEGLQYGPSDFITKSHVTEHPDEFMARIEAHLKIADLMRKCIDLEKLKILKATVMSVDHEIRNPLLSIGLIMEKMKDCPNCSTWYDRGKQSVQRIIDALEKMSKTQETTTTDFKGQEIIEPNDE